MRRYAAVLLLREMAEAAPAVFNVHVRLFIDAIFNGLFEDKLIVREGSVAALRVRPSVLAQHIAFSACLEKASNTAPFVCLPWSVRTALHTRLEQKKFAMHAKRTHQHQHASAIQNCTPQAIDVGGK